MTQNNSKGSFGDSENKRPRGLAVLKIRNPERFYEIVSKGGKEAHRQRKAHEWTSEEARLILQRRREHGNNS